MALWLEDYSDLYQLFEQWRSQGITDLAEWLAKRATAGRMAPRGFPRDNRFN